jgi:hypothetical protein
VRTTADDTRPALSWKILKIFASRVDPRIFAFAQGEEEEAFHS